MIETFIVPKWIKEIVLKIEKENLMLILVQEGSISFFPVSLLFMYKFWLLLLLYLIVYCAKINSKNNTSDLVGNFAASHENFGNFFQVKLTLLNMYTKIYIDNNFLISFLVPSKDSMLTLVGTTHNWKALF